MSKKMQSKQVEKKPIVLVTGATSGIGSELVQNLLRMKYEVRVILRDHPRENVEWKLLPKGVKVYVADIRLTDKATNGALLEACKGVRILFHIAAATYNFNNSYNELINTNVIGTENVLRAYFDANSTSEAKLRFIYASSVTVYGYKRIGETLTEESEPTPKSAYSESKYMAEQVIKAFGTANKLIDYTILRIGVIYGKGYEHNFFRIFKLIKEQKLRYVGSGMNHLTLVHAKDVVAAFMEVMQNKKSSNSIYNVTDGVPYTQKELFKKSAEFLNANAPEKSIHPLLAQIGARSRGINPDQVRFLISDRIVSIDKIRKELGFRPIAKIDVEGKALAHEFLKKHDKEN